jgi:uncharacterized protein
VTDAPALVETHISILFFVGDRAYKLKKPVRFDFLDFSTRLRREQACHREVELNRRLAPDVYLGVADVIGPDGHPGDAIDHLVVMRRMPSDRRLSTLVATGAPGVDDELRRLAHLLAAFHSTAATGPEVTRVATPQALLARWDANIAELRRFVGPVLAPDPFDRADRLGRAWLRGRSVLLDQRCRDGRIRDGHGDLQAGDVFCLDDGPRVLDCIEFNDRLRYGDVVDDVAFLAMDLERLGDARAANGFVQSYRELSADRAPASLLHHYIAYRALVRSKVACLRWEQARPQGGGANDESTAVADQAAAEARALLGLGRAHLERARVRVVMVGGLPGTGKTTLARGLGARLAVPVLRSDEVRKELVGVDATHRLEERFGAGAYDDATTEATYGVLVQRARALVERGESVVVDASWTAAGPRQRLRAMADETATELVELVCEVEPAVAAARITHRLGAAADASDATPTIARAMAARADAWPEATVIDTHRPAEKCVDVAVDVISGAPAPAT